MGSEREARGRQSNRPRPGTTGSQPAFDEDSPGSWQNARPGTGVTRAAPAPRLCPDPFQEAFWRQTPASARRGRSRERTYDARLADPKPRGRFREPTNSYAETRITSEAAEAPRWMDTEERLTPRKLHCGDTTLGVGRRPEFLSHRVRLVYIILIIRPTEYCVSIAAVDELRANLLVNPLRNAGNRAGIVRLCRRLKPRASEPSCLEPPCFEPPCFNGS
jgi:hypothetical protein